MVAYFLSEDKIKRIPGLFPAALSPTADERNFPISGRLHDCSERETAQMIVPGDSSEFTEQLTI